MKYHTRVNSVVIKNAVIRVMLRGTYKGSSMKDEGHILQP